MTLANLRLKICIVEVTIIQNKRISCRFFPSQEILVFVYLKHFIKFIHQECHSRISKA